MDSLITAEARALAADDLLAALKRVALRDDAPALALRGFGLPAAWAGQFRIRLPPDLRSSRIRLRYKLEELSAEFHCRYTRSGNESPNIGFPLLDCSSVASS